MGYRNAMDVLPACLLEAIQKYIDGESIYIPRCVGHKKQWGELKNSRNQMEKRNREIYTQYQCGVSVKALAGRYYLSPKTVYKVIAAEKGR